MFQEYLQGLFAGYYEREESEKEITSCEIPLVCVKQVLAFACGDERGWPLINQEADQRARLDYCAARAVMRDSVFRSADVNEIARWYQVDPQIIQLSIAFSKTWNLANSRFASLTNATPRSLALDLWEDNHVGEEFHLKSVAFYMPHLSEYMSCLYRERNRDEIHHHYVMAAICKQRVMLALKACLYLRIVMNMPGVAAWDFDDESSEWSMFVEGVKFKVDTYLTCALGPLLIVCQGCYAALLKLAAVVYATFALDTAVAVLVTASILWMLWHLVRFVLSPVVWLSRRVCRNLVVRVRGFSLAAVEASKDQGLDRFVGTEVSEGVVTYNVVVGGKAVKLRARPGAVQVEEMAMPGSTLCASGRRPVGAIMIAREGADLEKIGCFWRDRDFLVTAKHVANEVANGLAEIYLVGTK